MNNRDVSGCLSHVKYPKFWCGLIDVPFVIGSFGEVPCFLIAARDAIAAMWSRHDTVTQFQQGGEG